MFNLTVRWKKDGVALSKVFESYENTSKEAMKDVIDQLFEILSYTPVQIGFWFEHESSSSYQILKCKSKKNYLSIEHAQADANSLNRKRATNLPKEAPYKCPFCTFWHVGAKKYPTGK
jgi:hypothetical protein